MSYEYDNLDRFNNHELYVCECCLIELEIGDTFSCRDYFGHTHDDAGTHCDLTGYVLDYFDDFDDFDDALVRVTSDSYNCQSCGQKLLHLAPLYCYVKVG